MKRKISVLLIFVLVLSIGYGVVNANNAEAKTKKTAATVTGKAMKITKKGKLTNEQMTEGYNRFSLKTLKETLKEEEAGKNVMISPASLMFALDMAAMGAQGDTYTQMANLLAEGANKRDLINFAKSYRKTLEKSGLMKIANSIWINENNLKQNNVQVNEEYLNLLRKVFKAAAASREFDETVKNEINSWISKHTNKMINNAVDRLDDKTIMLIINCMAFEGKWETPYEDYQINKNGKFTNYAGKSETAKMLSSEENWYLSSDTAQGFLKYYEGGKYAFMAMLPDDENISINDYIAGLSDDAFVKFFESRVREEVDTVTPAFTFDYGIKMNDMLQALGMEKPFDLSADFLKMLDPKTINPNIALYIGSVIQKTHIELDENGTKAAAVTIIDMKCEATCVQPVKIKKKVILNRPFAFAIMDTETGTPVFTGVVNTVAD
ncbi:MAG: serpin family protein [Lachnospiraceae bacterium]|nr:serpin family protein [Lachnospiraceae bacterium]